MVLDPKGPNDDATKGTSGEGAFAFLLCRIITSSRFTSDILSMVLGKCGQGFRCM